MNLKPYEIAKDVICLEAWVDHWFENSLMLYEDEDIDDLHKEDNWWD